MIETTIEPVISEAPTTVDAGLPASEAAQQLRDPSVPALVVLDDDDRVGGIVTESDFVALVAESTDPVTVGTIMSTPVTTITPETPIGLAADRMTEAGVKHLPVVTDDSYCGLVSLESIAPFLSRTRLQVVWKGNPTHIDPNNSSERTKAEASNNTSS